MFNLKIIINICISIIFSITIVMSKHFLQCTFFKVMKLVNLYSQEASVPHEPPAIPPLPTRGSRAPVFDYRCVPNGIYRPAKGPSGRGHHMERHSK